MVIGHSLAPSGGFMKTTDSEEQSMRSLQPSRIAKRTTKITHEESWSWSIRLRGTPCQIPSLEQEGWIIHHRICSRLNFFLFSFCASPFGVVAWGQQVIARRWGEGFSLSWGGHWFLFNEALSFVPVLRQQRISSFRI